jgi:Cu+-exporting ATPase
MNVDSQQAAGSSNYQGQTFYFCSQACKERFDKNPQQYVRTQAAEGQAQR